MRVREELKVLSDGIVVNDPRGMTRMLPGGGDWGNFYDRMGIDHSRPVISPGPRSRPAMAMRWLARSPRTSMMACASSR